MAARVVEEAIVRATEKATSLPNLPSINDLKSSGQRFSFTMTIPILFFFSKYLR
jgi:hypothetical protein